MCKFKNQNKLKIQVLYIWYFLTVRKGLHKRATAKLEISFLPIYLCILAVSTPLSPCTPKSPLLVLRKVRGMWASHSLQPFSNSLILAIDMTSSNLFSSSSLSTISTSLSSSHTEILEQFTAPRTPFSEPFASWSHYKAQENPSRKEGPWTTVERQNGLSQHPL